MVFIVPVVAILSKSLAASRVEFIHLAKAVTFSLGRVLLPVMAAAVMATVAPVAALHPVRMVQSLKTAIRLDIVHRLLPVMAGARVSLVVIRTVVPLKLPARCFVYNKIMQWVRSGSTTRRSSRGKPFTVLGSRRYSNTQSQMLWHC